MAYSDQPQSGAGGRKNAADRLLALIDKANIADDLTDEELGKIGSRVVEEYAIDKASRSDWEKRIAEATKLAMLVAEEKNYPFERAANIKYPLLTTAALQFNARAYPAIVQGNRVVKCVTWGNDPQGTKRARAERVSEHMSYQLLAQMPEWEEDTDKMLVILPIAGACFRKVYYDPALGRNCTRLITADRFVVNYRARSLADVPRTTEEMTLYPYEIQERINDGRFVKFEYGEAVPDEANKEAEQNDPTAPHLFLEQHRRLDLDNDGYPEPYIVTVHKQTEKVCRIVANYSRDTVTVQNGKVRAIRKQDFYVAYRFLPSPDGGFYGWGFGWLLADITEAINATLNQMLDAGHLANVQGGLVSAQLGIKEKSIRLKMGEWRVVNTSGPINQAIMPITYPGPSAVLFNLLGLLVEAGRDVAAIKDVLTGEVRQNMTAAATLALIEQGLQVFTSIYKRVHRALKSELGILARLNRENLSPEEYAAFFDAEQIAGPDGQPMPVPTPEQDYSEKDMDILPVSDPNVASRMQQLAKAQLVFDISKDNPTVNPLEATKRMFEAAEVEDIETLLIPPPQPDPMQEQLLQIAAMLELQERDVKIDKARAEVVKTETGAMKDVADIANAEKGNQLNRVKVILDAIKAELAAEQAQSQMEAANGQGRVPGMEGQPGNAMGAGPAGPALGGPGGCLEGTPVPLNGGGGIGLGEPASAGGL